MTRAIVDLSVKANLRPEGDPAAHCDFSNGLITQSSEKYFEELPKARVTGSAIHKALGLSTLEEQQ